MILEIESLLNNNYFTGRSYPFKIGVVTDDNEACIVNTADMAHMCEASELPGGIMGFALGFSQKSC